MENAQNIGFYKEMLSYREKNSIRNYLDLSHQNASYLERKSCGLESLFKIIRKKVDADFYELLIEDLLNF